MAISYVCVSVSSLFYKSMNYKIFLLRDKACSRFPYIGAACSSSGGEI